VKHEQSLLVRLYNSYIYTLRLPLPVFFLIMFLTPLLLSVVFTAFYLLDVDGLSIPEDQDWGRRSWWDHIYGFAGETHFKVFIFSLSLCTTFGGTGVEARSPYTLLLANLNTLMAQLIFVFLSGAGMIAILSLVIFPAFLILGYFFSFAQRCFPSTCIHVFLECTVMK
jgi:inward rectifier potassium channel